MRRHLFIFTVILFLVGCGETEKPTSSNKAPIDKEESQSEVNSGADETTVEHAPSINLNGAWQLISREYKGKPIQLEAKIQQRLEINDSTFVLTAKNIDRGIIKYFGNQMDIYSKEGMNAGKHFKALYKLEGDVLTVCYDLSGENYPGEFTTALDNNNFLAVFKKK